MSLDREVRTWHQAHHDDRTVGQRVADGTARLSSSWGFFSVQAAYAAPVLMMSQNRQALERIEAVLGVRRATSA